MLTGFLPRVRFSVLLFVAFLTCWFELFFFSPCDFINLEQQELASSNMQRLFANMLFIKVSHIAKPKV